MLKSFCDGQIFGQFIGNGPAEVVGLHGWARTRQDLLASLKGLNAIAVDLPGFGVSPEPPRAWGSDEYADLIASMMSGFSQPQVVLGHSFGGRVAVKLASKRPDLVAGMVLTGVPLLRKHAPPPPLAFRSARWAHNHNMISDSRMEKLRQKHGSADYRNAKGVMRSVLVRLVNESYEDCLPRIKCPVQLIWGAEDSVVPLQIAHDACAMIPDCRIDVLDDAGHMTPLLAAHQLNDAVRRLLEASQR